MVQSKKSRTKTLRPDGSITEPDVKTLHERMIAALSQGAKDLTIDCSRVEALDAMGLGLLVAAHNSCKKTGGRFRLSNVREGVAATMQVLGLDRHMEIKGG
jgi:anti-anti-sigma factor